MAYGTTYYAISLSTNVILTLLIIGRLLYYRHSLLENFAAALGTHYISLITVVVESAAVYSFFAVLFLVTYALNDPTNQIWLAVASASQVRRFPSDLYGYLSKIKLTKSLQQIANLLIIYRLADGSAWKIDTLVATAALRFQSGTNDAGHVASFHRTVPPAALDGSSDPELKEVV